MAKLLDILLYLHVHFLHFLDLACILKHFKPIDAEPAARSLVTPTAQLPAARLSECSKP